MNGNKLKIFKEAAGFTLMELLVAIAVFAGTIVAVSGIQTSAINSQRKNINNQDVIDNARFILETIGRSIRQSDITSSSSSSITLSHPAKGALTYAYSNSQILENTVNLNSSNVSIDSLNFFVQGSSLSDNLQPRVTISISLSSKNKKSGTASSINLQTTITPRNLQVNPGS